MKREQKNKTEISPKPMRLVIGRNSVRELIESDPERIVELLVSNQGKGDDEKQQLVSRARALDVQIQFVSDAELTASCESHSHQSFVARVKEKPAVGLKEFIQSLESADRALVIMLDAVQDPHNLGAILRAAECFGVDAVIWSKNRGVALTAAASKVSVGASELVTMIEVSNLVEAARRFKDAGFWLVGAQIGPQSQPLSKFEFPPKAVLILGSEGEGIQPLLQKNIDYPVFIPMHGQIDSLNVSQATAVLLYAARNKVS